ncbi:carbohydrate ABC transporter permease [Enterovibrio coralii]|uniref:carbohydrate ABC transporter permease n=1 Tax=Enterovibrio coralii TaxID=294935 RepID=UPI000AA336CB|nr:sugar ABC transporter permease [Enterovibrio coralii]
MNDYAEMQRRRQHLYGWFLLTPAAILLSLFAFYPSLATFWESLFSKGTRRRPSEFVGTENYSDLFADPTFWIVVENNLFYAAMTIPLSIIIALVMALWANGKISGKGFVRTAYFTPTVLPMIAAANLWLFFYTPDLGVLDQIGALFGFESVNC